ncbi:tbc1 domain containing kinase [Anaeramoeba flamelloides]|uniref:Tbc1 domain containing kinase n=1 Tax=Anaeramoeba flamelloides TaxID=1746091 RepID=A0ABQ8XZU4_9EUKA|nr:tbc1 domain containing kinase [Anaeramoeba flamelloides]
MNSVTFEFHKIAPKTNYEFQKLYVKFLKLKQLYHKNLITILDVVHEEGVLCVVTNYYKQTLQPWSYLNQAEDAFYKQLFDLICALNYLQQNYYLPNIFYQEEIYLSPNRELKLRIGLKNHLNIDDLCFLAPEILFTGITNIKEIRNEKAFIWSFGIGLVELMLGIELLPRPSKTSIDKLLTTVVKLCKEPKTRLLFQNVSLNEITNKHKNQTKKRKILPISKIIKERSLQLNKKLSLPKKMKEIIYSCLSLDPDCRPTIQELNYHPLFDNYLQIYLKENKTNTQGGYLFSELSFSKRKSFKERTKGKEQEQEQEQEKENENKNQKQNQKENSANIDPKHQQPNQKEKEEKKPNQKEKEQEKENKNQKQNLKEKNEKNENENQNEKEKEKEKETSQRKKKTQSNTLIRVDLDFNITDMYSSWERCGSSANAILRNYFLKNYDQESSLNKKLKTKEDSGTIGDFFLINKEMADPKNDQSSNFKGNGNQTSKLVSFGDLELEQNAIGEHFLISDLYNTLIARSNEHTAKQFLSLSLEYQVPNNLRPKIWEKILNLSPKRIQMVALKIKKVDLKLAKPIDIDQIQKDAIRCHQKNALISSNFGQKKLINILTVWSITEHKRMKKRRKKLKKTTKSPQIDMNLTKSNITNKANDCNTVVGDRDGDSNTTGTINKIGNIGGHGNGKELGMEKTNGKNKKDNENQNNSKNGVYWQGLDSVCATLLALRPFDHVWVYAMFKRIVRKFYLKQLADPSGIQLKNSIRVLDLLLAYHLPGIKTHLIDVGIPDSITFATPWILTLFSHSYNFSTIYLLWDQIIPRNKYYPIFISVAIFRSLEKQILDNNMFGVMKLLASPVLKNTQDVLIFANQYFHNTPKSIYSHIFQTNNHNNDNDNNHSNENENENDGYVKVNIGNDNDSDLVIIDNDDYIDVDNNNDDDVDQIKKKEKSNQKTKDDNIFFQLQKDDENLAPQISLHDVKKTLFNNFYCFINKDSCSIKYFNNKKLKNFNIKKNNFIQTNKIPKKINHLLSISKNLQLIIVNSEYTTGSFFANRLIQLKKKYVSILITSNFRLF